MPRGGARAGAGRKPKSAAEKALTGNPGHRGRVLVHPAFGGADVPMLAPVDEFDAPNDLSVDERMVWLQLAPFAFRRRTLTKATTLAFCLLCRNVVLERRYAGSMTDAGGSNHRGMIQRIDAELTAFDLRPMGKPILDAVDVPADKPAQKTAYW